MAEKVSVTELNGRVKSLLRDTPSLNDIWVVGEISNFKLYSSGHCYFTIKDQTSMVSAVLFRNARSRLSFEPGDTMKIEAFGSVDLYPERGSYQFIVQSMRKSGTGDLYLEYERLRRKLEAEGLFDRSRKRPLPRYPSTIGVVTSPTGAVIHDIITTTARLFPVDILLAPAKVQGEGAAESVVKGIELLNRAGVDMIIVGRGGGSLEDLWAFNEEPVVRAIAASKIPVISSVGHETDTTLSDFAADVRAPTPTGAAEMAVRDRREIVREIDSLMSRAGIALESVLRNMHRDFDVVDSKLRPRRAMETVEYQEMRVDDLSNRAANALGSKLSSMNRAYDAVGGRPESAVKLFMSESHRRFQRESELLRPSLSVTLSESKMRFGRVSERLLPRIGAVLDGKRAGVQTMSARLDALNPYSVLNRGYSFVTTSDGRAVSSVKELEPGSGVVVRMKDGKASATIRDIEEFQ